MRARDLLHETTSSLTANKGRTGLTVLGVVIGIAAVIAMVSVIGGARQSIVKELGLDQSRAVMINVGGGAALTVDDAEVIETHVDGYEFVTTTQSWGGEQISTSERSVDTASISGFAPHAFQGNALKTVSGRLFTDDEYHSGAMVTVIDKNLAKKLFSDNDEAIGNSVQIGNDSYRIVGVVEGGAMTSFGENAYLPLDTFIVRISGNRDVYSFIGYVNEGEDAEKVVADTYAFFEQSYNAESLESMSSGQMPERWVSIMSMESIKKEFDSVMIVFQLIMTAVASISLLVGGIGIMNMMLTNVTERIREIGLRKALGARKHDIVSQFLMESIAITMIGGIIGTLLGYGGAFILAFAGSAVAKTSIMPYFSIKVILLVVGICVAVGVIFGYGPARRAARLDPVESLRYQ